MNTLTLVACAMFALLILTGCVATDYRPQVEFNIKCDMSNKCQISVPHDTRLSIQNGEVYLEYKARQ